MKLTDDEFQLLNNSATENYDELYTADWSLRTLTPSSSDEDLKQRGQRAVKSLVEKRLVALYRCSAWIGGTYEVVAPDKVKEVLAELANWQVPVEDNAPYYCYTSTDEGWKAYEENGRERYGTRKEQKGS